MILLEDEEINKLWKQYSGSRSLFDEIAKAQLKKVVEWLLSSCDTEHHEGFDGLKGNCCQCWQALLEEAEQKVEFAMIPPWLQGWEKEAHLACIECGEYKPNDDRVKAGLKCSECIRRNK